MHIVRAASQPDMRLGTARQAWGGITLSGAVALSRRAAGALSGHRCVSAMADGRIAYTHPDDPQSMATLLGITLGAGLDGDDVNVAAFGLVTEPTWAWTPGAALYVGANGALTETPPDEGLLRRVGVAVTGTQIHVAVGEPVFLLKG